MTNADNARQFSIDLSKLVANELPVAVAEVTRAISLAALRGVILKTPVGNPDLWKSKPPKGYVGGQFRGAWQLSVGSPGAGITGQKSPGRRGDSAAAEKAVSEADARLRTLEPYGVVYIVNGLPYAQRLEDGWSTQAPGGMVALTVAELNNTIVEYKATFG